MGVLQFLNLDVNPAGLVRPAFFDRLSNDLGVILPEPAFRHAILQELLQIIRIRLGYPPLAMLMAFALGEKPQYS